MKIFIQPLLDRYTTRQMVSTERPVGLGGKLLGILLRLLGVSALGAGLAQGGMAQTIVAPGIVVPNSTYLGKTYRDWSAAWWQYLMSLPTTNNPMLYDPLHPVIPVSTGQSGPVWFIGGDYSSRGPQSQFYTYDVPGNVALFLGIESFEGDNANCPNPGTKTAADLLAVIETEEDRVTNIVCTIDGAPVDGLANVLTTPYRVQASFDFICPAVHSYLQDFKMLPCYESTNGVPYVVNAAVSDGVFLLIPPLSPGPHEIYFESSPAASMPVRSVTLEITTGLSWLNVVTSQTGDLVLSWPQRYLGSFLPPEERLESSPSLNEPSWTFVEATDPPVLKQGEFQVTIPAASAQQFFRLRIYDIW